MMTTTTTIMMLITLLQLETNEMLLARQGFEMWTKSETGRHEAWWYICMCVCVWTAKAVIHYIFLSFTFFVLSLFMLACLQSINSSGNMHVHCTDVTRLLNRNVLFSVLAAIFLHNLFSYFPIHHWRLHYSLYHAHSLYTMPSRCNILLLPTGSRSIQRSERDVEFFFISFFFSQNAETTKGKFSMAKW